jgi:tRNA A37 methylthiotransferase MiaB
LPDQLPPGVIAERKARLAEIHRELASTFARQLRGRRLEVLVEREATNMPGHFVGTSCRHLPVLLPGPAAWIRRLVPVRITGFDDAFLRGEPFYEIFTESKLGNHSDRMCANL